MLHLPDRRDRHDGADQEDRGADVESGGAGNDVMHALARDKMLDQIDCGDGVDTVWLNAKESDTYVNCEIVKTVVTNRKDDGE